MLQLKISRTKKRLSSESWVLPAAMIAIMGLLFVLNTSMRATTLSFAYGVVRGNIPVLSVPLKDQSPHRVETTSTKSISEETTTVIIAANQDLYFGPIKAFSTDYPNPRTKFVVRNRQGSAQFGELLTTLEKWLADRKESSRIALDGIVVLVPAATTPVSVVTQAMAQLRKDGPFSHVVLANGMY